MHAFHIYSAFGLVAIACLWPAGAGAQDGLSGPATGATGPSAGVSASDETATDDLAARVNRLEEALKKVDGRARENQNNAADKPWVELGGRIYFDHVLNNQDALNRQVYGNAPNGTDFRTLRLKAQGNAFQVVDYKLELDLATSAAVFRDVYVGVSELPLVGNVRVGHFFEPYGLESTTSTNYITFMSRSMGREAFSPQRNTGVMFFDWTADQNMTWQAGVFDTDIVDNPATRIADELSQSFTARVTWLPWYDECTEGRGLLHTGAAYSYRHPYHHSRTFSTLADEPIGIAYINTGALSLADYQLAGLEAATVYGPLSVQSECFIVRADPTAAGASDMTFTSFYVTVSYFLTGEHRRYRRDAAIFDRVRPFEDFFHLRAEDGAAYTGKGAWELAVRYDYIDVGDAGPSAGMCAAETCGVNWYLNAYTRVMWNYVHAQTHKDYTDSGDLDAFMMRFQIDF